ncbi:MAG: hypothetical protein ACLGGY_04555 [Gammaproteobacteria bacterium]
MKLPYTKQEITYLAIAAFILLFGTLVCFIIKNASWMAGVGALVVISGVFFASKDFQELIIARMTRLAPLRREFVFVTYVDEIEESEKRNLTADERNRLREEFAKKWEETHAQAIKATEKRHRFVEAYIIIIGTFVNGFGEAIIEPFIK